MKTIDSIIKRLDLLPHPEGGYYRETFRSETVISKISLPEGYQGLSLFR